MELTFPSWVCIAMRSAYCRGDKMSGVGLVLAAAEEIITDHRVVDLGCDSNEYYLLIKCRSWKSEIYEKIMKCPSVERVVTDCDYTPTTMTDSEVSEFIFSSLPSGCDELSVGDIVYDSEGTFSGLYGVVVRKLKKKCDVLYRFHMHFKISKVPIDRLTRIGNFYEVVKKPVLKGDLNRGC